MCGIAGIVRPGVDSTADVLRMCETLVHRGPDGGAVWSRDGVSLGHRRLAILDLSVAGRQPMTDPEGRFVLVYNGEVYNYLELRAELERTGAKFRTGTDTEVVLAAYRAWGPGCVRRFNGMWALAILDTRERTLFLSRDRLGIKPLYYARTGNELVFASEIKAITAVRPNERRVNREHLARFLTDGIRDADDRTAYENVRSFPPASTATYDMRTGELRAERFWSIPVGETTRRPREERVDELRDLVTDSIRLRLRSDVPVGTCLSGGVDSSGIAGLATSLRSEPIQTFSGLYEDRDCNEERYVDLVNRHLGCVPHPVRPSPDGTLVDDLRTIAWHQDEPTAGPGLYTQFHVMRSAHRDVRVLLDGQGGDELFAGYLFYLQTELLERMRRRPVLGRLRATASVLAAARHWGFGFAPRIVDAILGGWPSWALRRRSRTTIGESLLHPELRTLRAGLGARFAGSGPCGNDVDDHLHRQVTAESLPTLLQYEDRNSMAWSIEARVPLLDHRIVEFAFRTPTRDKLNGTWTKWILRRAIEERLPRAVVWRRSKMGYPTPFARWLRDPRERPAIEPLLRPESLADHGLFDPVAVARLWEAHLAGADHSWLLYRVLMTSLWLRDAIDGWHPHPVVGRPVAPTVVLEDRLRQAS